MKHTLTIDEQLLAIKWVLTGQKSKQEVAWLLNRDYSTICAWMRGHRSPRITWLYTHLVTNRFGGDQWIETDNPSLAGSKERYENTRLTGAFK